MSFNTLSILIPVFNEGKTIEIVLDKIISVQLTGNLHMEIVIIDDCSTDNTEELVSRYIASHAPQDIRYIRQARNLGKGAAIREGIKRTSGDYTLIQDGDLEYDPREYNLLIQPVLEGFADVVFGSRFMGGNPHRVLFFWHTIGNRFLTFLSNLFTNLNLTDMETCYKLFRSDMLKGLTLKENRFGFEPEVTARISKVREARIYEVGISYYGRTYDQGKKIKWLDGLRAIWCILKYNLFTRPDSRS
ncbi:MAG TPA: glycosyltransferase family 2 protein [Chitinophagaceae bacterium]|nr:glycosyltransferase family 2 protein [Chitinophagaceae bacterium]